MNKRTHRPATGLSQVQALLGRALLPLPRTARAGLTFELHRDRAPQGQARRPAPIP